MWGWILGGLAAVVGLQRPVAAAVWIDARQRRLAGPHKYPIAILNLLLLGWLLVPLYIRRRDELPRVGDHETAQQGSLTAGDERVTWQVDLDGLVGLPTRLAFGLATLGRWLWASCFVLVPSLILGVSVFVEPLIGWYAIFALGPLYLVLSHGRRVTGSGAIDTDAEVLALHWGSRGAAQPTESNETGLGLAESVRVRRVGEYAIAKIQYEEPRLPRLRGFVVPTRKLPQVRRALEACGVTVSEPADGRADPRGLAAVVGRSFVSFLTVVVGLVVVVLLYVQ